MGLLRILISYIVYWREIIIVCLKFDKEKVEKCFYIVEGLIRVFFILDEVIVLICVFENKVDVKENLKVSYEFLEV